MLGKIRALIRDNDAKHYQEKAVLTAIKEVQK
ncbi:MAG: hypothetical protein A4E64_00937 [Syntrophorhabdus sp. PtaU1.Bin058]|nr:MAG: hypothetical protein A4E64_00937 [Syntrophorhabdus sp. PtaU1.Bin058]